MQFFESFSSFPNKYTKKGKLKDFTSWSLTRRGADWSTGGYRRRSPLPCTHVSGAYKKQPRFEENWMNAPKMLFFDSKSALAFDLQPFKVTIF